MTCTLKKLIKLFTFRSPSRVELDSEGHGAAAAHRPARNIRHNNLRHHRPGAVLWEAAHDLLEQRHGYHIYTHIFYLQNFFKQSRRLGFMFKNSVLRLSQAR